MTSESVELRYQHPDDSAVKKRAFSSFSAETKEKLGGPIRVRCRLLVEETLPDQVHQTKLENQLEAIKEGISDSYIIHCDSRWIRSFLMEETGQELDHDVLRDVNDWPRSQKR